jgi:hypothetical protein
MMHGVTAIDLFKILVYTFVFVLVSDHHITFSADCGIVLVLTQD